MNLTDLKQLMEERSTDSAAHIVHHARFLGIRTAVVARRRRRVAVLTACLVAVLAGITTAVVAARPPRGILIPPDPSPVRTIEGFPEYAEGARVVAAQSAQLPTSRIELTVVPSTLDLVIFMRCHANDPVSRLGYTVTVNRHHVADGVDCTGSVRPPSWAGQDVAIGQPATFVLTVTGRAYSSAGFVDVPLPASGGEIGLAVGVRVPFADYPLPPRPAQPLTPLDFAIPPGCSEASCPSGMLIRSDPADPTRPTRRTVNWQPVRSVMMIAQTPGLLHLKVNGVEVLTGEWWDYKGDGSGITGDRGGAWRELGLDLHAGDTVTVEAVPEHFTGQWLIVFYLP